MKKFLKVFAVLFALIAVSFSASAQTIPQTHDIIYKDSTRYMVVGVDKYDYKLVEFTPVDTLNWNNSLTINHTRKWFNFSDIFSTVDIYLGCGFAHNADKQDMVVSGSFDIFGFVIDYCGTGTTYGSSVRVGVWSDDVFNIYRFGFDVPVFKNISIAPLVGVYKYQSGYTNGYEYYIDDEGNIHNEFTATSMKTSVDYGVRIAAKFDLCKDYVTINGYISISNHITMFGIGTGVNFKNISNYYKHHSF